MNRKLSLIVIAPLALGFSAAWAQDMEPDTPELPSPAADEAREAATLPAAAADGLSIAAEATIRLMESDEDLVTNDLELPMLPPQGAAGQRGLDIASQAQSGRDNFGQEVAEDARNNAREAVEGRGRAEDLPVDVPGRPENPGRPDDLPGGPPGQ